MSECEYDELVVLPTRGGSERVDEGDEGRHEQPCPGERCGFALMAVGIASQLVAIHGERQERS